MTKREFLLPVEGVDFFEFFVLEQGFSFVFVEVCADEGVSAFDVV